jgi:hypothetical protein
MQNLGPWLNATKDHVVQHWQSHLVPLVLLYAGGMVVGMVASVLFMAGGFFISIIGAIVQSGLIMALAMLVFFGLGMVGIIAMGMLLTPIYFGHVRVVLRAHRGEAPDPSDLYWGFRNLGKVAAYVVISGTISLAAAMLCYFPALLVSVAFMFAVVAMVDRDLGAIDALEVSWELVKPRFLELLVLMFIYFAAIMVLSYVPLVGPFLGTIAWVGSTIVIYDDLVQRDHFGV